MIPLKNTCWQKDHAEFCKIQPRCTKCVYKPVLLYFEHQFLGLSVWHTESIDIAQSVKPRIEKPQETGDPKTAWTNPWDHRKRGDRTWNWRSRHRVWSQETRGDHGNYPWRGRLEHFIHVSWWWWKMGVRVFAFSCHIFHFWQPISCRNDIHFPRTCQVLLDL